MATQPEPYRYTDAYGDDLYVGWHTDDNDQPVLAFESDDTIHVPLADVEQVVEAIRAQARLLPATTTVEAGR